MTGKYPLQLEPFVKEVVWGGRWLADTLGRPGGEGARLGESWEAYSGSRIANGIWQGQTLGDVFARCGAEFTGSAAVEYPKFPLLVKFIDAHQNLSIQVHPDDALARQLEDYPFGKTEFWYVLEAAPDAHIYYGLNTTSVTRDELQRALADQDLLRYLKRVPVTAGDVVFMPAGTIHALTAGVVVYELQQDSDITYRLYDWGRTDREIHLEKGLQAIDPECADMQITHPLAADMANKNSETSVQVLAACRYFRSELWRIPAAMTVAACLESFTLLTVIAGSGTLSSPGEVNSFEAIDLTLGRTICLPAGLEYQLQTDLTANKPLEIITGQMTAPGLN